MDRHKMTDDELLAITGNEIRNCIGYRTGRLSEMRRRNLQFYLGKPVGELAPPEIEGRSSAVDTSVQEVIEWMLPSLLRTFTSGDDVVEFLPEGEEDEDGAKQTTAVANYVFYRQNPGFQILQTWFKDAMISKVGLVKVWFDRRKVETREDYAGMTDIEVAKLQDDDEIEIIAHTPYPDPDAEKQKRQAMEALQTQFGIRAPRQGEDILTEVTEEEMAAAAMALPPDAMHQYQQAAMRLQAMPVPMLHDVSCKRTKIKGQVRVENVPPEEFIISRDAKSIRDARVVGHQVLRTRSDLRLFGYADVDAITSDDTMATLNAERVERISFNDEFAFTEGGSNNPGDSSQDRIWVTELYMRVDADGDGIAEMRKIVRAGNRILENEIIDEAPLVSITPIILPHQFFGLCPADQAIESQKQRTATLRAMFDNLYLQVNGRYFAVENQVNLDDLLASRPGGVVRMKQPGMAGRLDQGAGDMGAAQYAMELLEQQRESRTGWSRTSQGLNPDALQPQNTATGMNIVTNRADMRLELIARNFAETGVSDLFRQIVKLLAQHQNKGMIIRLNNRWVEVDPAAWRNQYDLTINVGLGTGNKDQQVQHLMMLMGMQKEAFLQGMAGPEHLHHTASKIVNALGFKNEEAFFPDPRNMPPQQKAPSPEEMRIQADQQKFAAQMQADRAKLEIQAHYAEMAEQRKEVARQQELALEAQKQSQEANNDMLERQHKAELDAKVAASRMEFDAWKARLDAETRVLVAAISASKGGAVPGQEGDKPEGASPVTEPVQPQMVDSLAAAFERFTQAMSAPKMIVHDAMGRPVGIQHMAPPVGPTGGDEQQPNPPMI